MGERRVKLRSALIRSNVSWTFVLLVGAAVLVTGISGFLIARDPLVGLVVGLSPVALYLLVASPVVRLLAIVVGGLFVFGSSSDVGPAKIVYAGILILSAGVSFWRLLRRPPSWAAPFAPVIVAGALLVAVLILATIGSPLEQDPQTVIRQSIFYLMLPLAPVIGLDVGRSVSPNVAMGLIGIIGTLAAVGFATDWLDRRGVSSLEFGRFILSSLMLPALAFALACVQVSLERGIKRLLWLAPVVVIPVAMLVTGTRTNLILFVALLGVLGSKSRMRVTPARAIQIAIFGVATAALLVPVVGQYVINRPGFLESRIRAFLTVAEGNGEADGSFSGRASQTDYAWNLLNAHPAFGMGPGFVAETSLDTPLLTVVKIGWIGTFVLACFLIAFFVAIERSARLRGHSAMHTAFRGFAIVTLANIPFGTPIEDRGFGFALMLGTMGVVSFISKDRPDYDTASMLQPANTPSLALRRT